MRAYPNYPDSSNNGLIITDFQCAANIPIPKGTHRVVMGIGIICSSDRQYNRIRRSSMMIHFSNEIS